MKPVWEVCAVLGTVCAVVVGAILLARCDEHADPCVRRVHGQVHEPGPHGEDAPVNETWCAEWKPGRGPEGGAP